MTLYYSLLCENGQSAGSFFDNLSTEDKARYGSSGAYRCYGSLQAWLTSCLSRSYSTDTEWLEIADAFDDDIGSSSLTQITTSFNAFAIIIETKIKGVRTAAFHNGDVSGGYRIINSGSYQAVIIINRSDVLIDGINVDVTGSGVNAIRGYNGARQVVRNCIARSQNDIAFRLQGTASEYYNNIGWGSYINFQFDSYSMQYSRCYNNLAVKGSNGFYVVGSPCYGNYHNNVAYGNTTNWSAAPSNPNQGGMQYNAGASSGGTPWGPLYTLTNVTAESFVDYANNDFRLRSNSVLRDSGNAFLGFAMFDILDKTRPNYSAGTATDAVDRGPFEYDSGNGEPPITVTVDGMATGSMIKAARESDGVVIYSGAGPTFETGYMGRTSVEVRCASATPFYKPWQTLITPVVGLDMTITALQELDE